MNRREFVGGVTAAGMAAMVASSPWKAMAAIIAAGAVFFGGVLAVSNWVRPAPQSITVHIVHE